MVSDRPGCDHEPVPADDPGEVTTPGPFELQRVLAEHAAAVLTRAGFRRLGPANPSDLGGKPGDWFERTLVAGTVDAMQIRARG